MLLRVQEVICTARAMENSAVVGCPEAICGRLVQSTVVWHGSALETAVILSARAERDALAGRHALFGVPRALRLRC